MRKILILVVLLAAFVAGAALFFLTTTPRQSAGLQVPPGPREQALIASVPESAEAFAIVPTAAAVGARLRLNPVARSMLDAWVAQHPLPPLWMIGGADLVAWKSGTQIHYVLHLDPVRALLVRWSRARVMTSSEGPFIDPASMAEIAELSARLPAGDALVVQRSGARGSFPPIGRPAVTSVRVSESEIRLTSVSAIPPAAAPAATLPSRPFPRSAILSVAFASAPAAAGDLNRLFGAKVSSLLDDGGTISIYGVDTRKLLPRPLGVIALPNDPARQAAFESFVKSLRVGEAVGVRVRTAETPTTLALSFDDSIDRFQKDVFEASGDPNARWGGRIDPAAAIPILRDLGRNVGLRIAAPHLFRSARDLDRWIDGLEGASVIEASDWSGEGAEVFRVRIVAK